MESFLSSSLPIDAILHLLFDISVNLIICISYITIYVNSQAKVTEPPTQDLVQVTSNAHGACISRFTVNLKQTHDAELSTQAGKAWRSQVMPSSQLKASRIAAQAGALSPARTQRLANKKQASCSITSCKNQTVTSQLA